jgi:prepilin peptidase dependent protein B
MLIHSQTRPVHRKGFATRGHQAGATLIETLIALALSLIVTSGMVVLMSSTMGTSTRIIHMTQLTDELRNVMSMLTRDVRRANYSANALYCYGHSNCGNSGAATQSSDITIVSNASVQCITFQLDRAYLDSSGSWAVPDGNASNDPKGGFRRREVTVDGDARGVIEMWTGAEGTAMPNCSANVTQGWVEVTNPNTVDITEFTIDDGLSLEQTVTQESGSSFTQRQRQITIAIEGELVVEQKRDAVAGMELGDQAARRRIEDTITVRNDFIKDYVPAS